MSKKRITVGDAIRHADDIDVASALQSFALGQVITRSALQNIYHYSHALKNHLNVKPFLKQAGLKPNREVDLVDLIKAEIK